MIAFFIWRGPDWNLVADAFRFVAWDWVVAAIALNLLSVVARAGAWHQVIEQAMPPPKPRFRAVFSAFGVGLFANAVLPGRIGELARVAVLTRRIEEERRGDTWAMLLGTVFAHRVLRPLPDGAPDRLRRRDREDPALGADQPDRVRDRRPSRCSLSRSRARGTAIAPCSRTRKAVSAG